MENIPERKKGWQPFPFQKKQRAFYICSRLRRYLLWGKFVQVRQFKSAVGEVPLMTIFTQLKMISQQIIFSSQIREFFPQTSCRHMHLLNSCLCACPVCALRLIQKELSPEDGKVRDDRGVYPSQ